MTQAYLVECYWPGATAAKVAAGAARAQRAANDLAGVAYVQSILVPEDEIVFYVFNAASTRLVQDASTRASLPFERIVGSVLDTGQVQ